jgi:hypothetical protein
MQLQQALIDLLIDNLYAPAQIFKFQIQLMAG